jgi:hypothetical protein
MAAGRGDAKSEHRCAHISVSTNADFCKERVLTKGASMARLGQRLVPPYQIPVVPPAYAADIRANILSSSLVWAFSGVDVLAQLCCGLLFLDAIAWEPTSCAFSVTIARFAPALLESASP